MNATFFAVIGAVTGGLITAGSTAAVSYYQRTSSMREAHRIRAFEHHLALYERIFVTVRSVLDALNHFETVNRRVGDRSDPVLQQLLNVLNHCAYEYCETVDWRYNPSMAYLDLRLEERCLGLRDLLLQWLSQQRITSGNMLRIRRNDEVTEISASKASALRIGDYQELIIEKRNVVTSTPGDYRLMLNVREASTSVIKNIKDVMAY